jgi:hypothetical protein
MATTQRKIKKAKNNLKKGKGLRSIKPLTAPIAGGASLGMDSRRVVV